MASIQDFAAWFKSRGGHLHPAVEFANSSTYGFHLRVKPDLETPHLEKDTTVISCPHSLTLSALNAQPEPPDPASTSTDPPNVRPELNEFTLPLEMRMRARPQCVATFWLCVQFLLGEQSAWAPYVRLLPRPPRENGDADEGPDVDGDEEEEEFGVIDTAVWWGDEERVWVQGTNLEKGIRDLEHSWRVEWDKWGAEVVTWAEEMGLPGLNWTLFKWAVSIYGSRAFSSAVLSFVKSSADAQWSVLQSYDPHALLYPGVDFLNHSAETKNCWFCDEQCFAIVCNDEPGPGEQVFNSYGMKDNGSLLLSFGFALPNNPRDAFALKLPATKDPPFLDAIRQHQSPPPEQYQSPASLLRFAGSLELKNAGILPSVPGESIALNERETLLSHDADNHVHYLRSPSELSSLSRSRSLKPNPGYPWHLSESTAHLGGFPVSLLNNLAARLANTREATCVTLEPRSYAEEMLWMQLGPRNLTALSVLLLGRLRLEISRFEALDLSPPKSDMSSNATRLVDMGSQTQENEAGGKNTGKLRRNDRLQKGASRLKRRQQNVVIYIESQMKILKESFDLLRDWVFRTFAGLDRRGRSPESLDDETGGNGVGHAKHEIITVPRAVELLRRLEPAVADEFVAGVLMMLGDEEMEQIDNADEAVWWDQVRAMRSGLTERDEEDVLVLWLGVVFAALYENDGPREFDEEVRGVLEGYCKFWAKWYGVDTGERVGIRGDRTEVGQVVVYDDDDESIETMAMIMQQEVGTIGAELDELRIWTAGCWTGSLGFLKACVSAVREESVSIMIGVEEYGIFERAERQDESAFAGLQGVQPVFEANEDSRRIVGLCLPGLAA